MSNHTVDASSLLSIVRAPSSAGSCASEMDEETGDAGSSKGSSKGSGKGFGKGGTKGKGGRGSGRGRGREPPLALAAEELTEGVVEDADAEVDDAVAADADDARSTQEYRDAHAAAQSRS